MTRRKDPRSARLPDAATVADDAELPAFTPVPRKRMRRRGWSAARQREFIAHLAETGSVRAACRRMGVGEHQVYVLRNHPEGESFRKAWEAALDMGIQRIEDTAMDRALNGVDAPVFYHGEKVGDRTVYNDRLLMFMLRTRAPERFGAGGNRGLGGLNAVSQMQLDKLRKEWRAQWEAERRNVSIAEVKASIDRKIEEVRRRVDAERAALWQRLSPETRAAWDAFVALRERDLAALAASPAERKAAQVEWDEEADAFTRPPPSLALPQPRAEWGLEDESLEP
jgi:hypothetical protein